MVVVDPYDAHLQDKSFQFDCHLGRYQSVEPELRAGDYRIYWEAVSPDGLVKSHTAGNLDPVTGIVSNPAMLERVHVTAGVHVDFDKNNRPDEQHVGQPTNFASGGGAMDVKVTFALSPGAATGVACATASVRTVRYVWRYSNAVSAPLLMTSKGCPAEETVQWNPVTYDRYALEVHGSDVSGIEKWRGVCEGLLFAPSDSQSSRPSQTLSCLVDKLPGL